MMLTTTKINVEQETLYRPKTNKKKNKNIVNKIRNGHT